MNNTTQPISENEIVSLLLLRDIRGVAILYDQYGDFIFGIICKITKTRDLAEIVLQDTFLKVWDKIDTFAVEKGRFLTWLINIARNTAIDMTRSKHYKQTLKLISLENVPPDIEINDLGLKMEYMDIRSIVSRLDKKYCKIIQLIYFEGYTQAEVAKEMALPLGTVKGRVRKAFKDLRIIMEN